MDESHEEARQLLTKHCGELETLARSLLEREALDKKEILEVTGLPPAPPLENTKVSVSDVEPRRGGR
jgi:cell division protease FtsH